MEELMPLPQSKLSPEREAQLREILTQPKPDPRNMSSLERLLRVNLYKEMMTGNIEVPEDHLAYGVELLVADRTERATNAKEERKKGKAAGNGTSATLDLRSDAEKAADL